MSRFDKDIVDYNPLNIEESSCDTLMDELKAFILASQPVFANAIDNFNLVGKEYSIVELSDSIVLVMRRSEKAQIVLCIGYPFKLYYEDISSEYSQNRGEESHVSMSIHLRGKLLRDKQREMLATTLKKEHEAFEYIPVDSEREFQDLAHAFASEAVKDNSSCVYVDPYDFIGDSIYGQYFLDYFVKTYGIEKIQILSKAHRHTDFFHPSSPKDKPVFDEAIENSNFVIMPDLIDNHFCHTMEFLSKVKSKKLFVFIVSRNLIIEFDNGVVKMHHYTADDVLLKNESVREYMGNCLSPYVSPLAPKKAQVSGHDKVAGSSGGTDIFVNPFSSDVLKDISSHHVREVIEQCRTLFSKVYVSIGKGSDREKEWFDTFGDSGTLGIEVVPIKDSSLSDLARQLTRLNIGVALTADTAIAHLLTKMEIPNVTAYNDGFWDTESPQSLSAESPVGFCSTNCCQMPAIFPRNGSRADVVTYISDALKDIVTGFLKIMADKILVHELTIFQKKLSSFLTQMREDKDMSRYDELCNEYSVLKSKFANSPASWIFQIYDPISLLAGICRKPNARNIPLIHSAFAVSPANKVATLITSNK